MKHLSAFIPILLTLPVTVAQSSEIDMLLDSMQGTTQSNFQRSSKNGELNGCGIDFSVFGRDFATKQGAPFRAVGSYYFRQTDGNPQFWLKLGVQDISPQQLDKSTNAKFVNAFVTSGHLPTSKVLAKLPSNDSGFMLFVIEANDDSMNAWQNFLEDGRLNIGFNRKENQQDVNFNVDANVVNGEIIGNKFIRNRSRTNLNEVAACTERLIQQMVNKYK